MQIQKIQSVKRGCNPPFTRLKIGARLYEVIGFKKNRVKYKGNFKWQTDRKEIEILQINEDGFPNYSQEKKPFNIKLEELERTEKYGYSEVKFFTE